MQAPKQHYPVIVVGGGPTGLTIANLLGQEGIAVLLLERNEATVGEPRAVSIDDESLRTMQAAGLVDQILTGVVPGYGSHYYSPGGHCFAKVEPTGTPYGYPRRNAFRQPLLEAHLRDGLGRFDAVTPLFGHRLVAFDQTAAGVSVEIESAAGKTCRVTCDFLIGCDGASSLVRERLGILLSGTTFQERWLIVDLENVRNAVRHTEVFCDRRRPCITLPGPNGTRRYEFKLHPHERDEDLLAPASVARLLADHGADPDATIIRKVVYRFHARVAPKWSVGRVFLAGDAAHLTPPFAGQGMNSGIRDAHNLAWKLAAVVRGTAGPALLDSYAQERRDHVWEMIRLALRMGRVMSPRSALSGWLVRAFFRLLNIYPPARDYVAQMKYKPKPRFKAGFMLADAGRTARQTLVGRLFPQPLVQCDGRQHRLDEIVGNRFALILCDDDPDAWAQVSQPIWDRLDAVRVGFAPARHVRQIADPTGQMQALLAPYDKHVLLLRPDHYVAAAIPLAGIEQGAAAIEALLAAEPQAAFPARRTVEIKTRVA